MKQTALKVLNFFWLSVAHLTGYGQGPQWVTTVDLSTWKVETINDCVRRIDSTYHYGDFYSSEGLKGSSCTWKFFDGTGDIPKLGPTTGIFDIFLASATDFGCKTANLHAVEDSMKVHGYTYCPTLAAFQLLDRYWAVDKHYGKGDASYIVPTDDPVLVLEFDIERMYYHPGQYTDGPTDTSVWLGSTDLHARRFLIAKPH
jgi:hypothetical protein